MKMLQQIPLTRAEQQSPVLGIKEAPVFTVITLEWLSHRLPSDNTKDASLFYEQISIHQQIFDLL